MSSVAEEVVIRCKNLVRKEKLCEEDIRELSTFINNLISKNRNLSTQWPVRLLIGPLQKIWADGEIDHDEYIVLGELLGSIACVSEMELSQKELPQNDPSGAVKKCPHCEKVLLSSVVPRCSWCGNVLESAEAYSHAQDWFKRESVKDAWVNALNDLSADSLRGFFGNLYELPRGHDGAGSGFE